MCKWLFSGQNDISSSDVGLVFEGKYKIWKTEKGENNRPSILYKI